MTLEEKIKCLEYSVKGNGKDGLEKQVLKIQLDQKRMSDDINNLANATSDLKTAVSELMKFQTESETRDHIMNDYKIKNRVVWYFGIAQFITILGILLKFII